LRKVASVGFEMVDQVRCAHEEIGKGRNIRCQVHFTSPNGPNQSGTSQIEASPGARRDGYDRPPQAPRALNPTWQIGFPRHLSPSRLSSTVVLPPVAFRFYHGFLPRVEVSVAECGRKAAVSGQKPGPNPVRLASLAAAG
jgi:hypothetical protein